MKKNMFFVVWAILLMACGGNAGYEIKGTVSDPSLNGQYVILYENNDNAMDVVVLNTALVENGTFVMKGVQDEPMLCLLSFSPEVVSPQEVGVGENSPFSAFLTLENKKISVSLDVVSTVTGTPENDALTKFQAQMRPLNEGINALVLEYRANGGGEEALKAIQERYNQIAMEVSATVKAYIQNNTDKLSAGKILYDFRYELREEEQRQILENASALFKSAPGVIYMVLQLDAIDKVGIGKPFVDFEMPSPDGQAKKLSDYAGKGEYVLVDFWASWCAPCHQEVPYLHRAYEKYKSKGFEIIGVSFDYNQADWDKGIKDLQLTWPQMSDLKGWKSIASSIYGVNSIPHTVLLDKDGVIIARDLRGDALSEKLEELLN